MFDIRHCIADAKSFSFLDAGMGRHSPTQGHLAPYDYISKS